MLRYPRCYPTLPPTLPPGYVRALSGYLDSRMTSSEVHNSNFSRCVFVFVFSTQGCNIAYGDIKSKPPMHSRYFPDHCTRSGFNLVANCVFKLVVFKCRAVPPICWPPCPGQRLAWRSTEWCHCPTWRCPLTKTTSLSRRIPRNCTPPYATPIPASPVNSSIPPVNDLTTPRWQRCSDTLGGSERRRGRTRCLRGQDA